MFRESVEDLMGETITGDDNDCIIVQRDLLRNLCSVFLMCSDCDDDDANTSCMPILVSRADLQVMSRSHFPYSRTGLTTRLKRLTLFPYEIRKKNRELVGH